MPRPKICAIFFGGAHTHGSPRHALYVQPSRTQWTPFRGSVKPQPPSEAEPLFTAPNCPYAPAPPCTTPLDLSVWQKLFKILLLAATSKCQVFTITLLLLLLQQFYLILMGFFLPPTAECIKQSPGTREYYARVCPE